MTAFLLLALTIILGEPASRPAAACFDDSGARGQFAVWVYEDHTDWRAAREDPRGTLMFGFRPGKKKYRVSKLEYCRYLVDPETREMSGCQAGTLELLEFFPPERIVLRYSFTLDNGQRQEGELTASYCPKRAAMPPAVSDPSPDARSSSRSVAPSRRAACPWPSRTRSAT